MGLCLTLRVFMGSKGPYRFSCVLMGANVFNGSLWVLIGPYVFNRFL